MITRLPLALFLFTLISINPSRSDSHAVLDAFNRAKLKDANLPFSAQNSRNVEGRLLTNEEKDDESCTVLQAEYREICFNAPPKHAVAETEAFCDAFRDMCKNLLSRTPNLPVIDHTAYCRKHKERFEFVCPKPLRFGSYVDEAVAFCTRYQGKCPDVPLPSDIVPYKKPPKHIYIREVKQYCDRVEKFAKTYCIIPAVLKIPTYALQCLIYKNQCIDIYTRVVYIQW
uniref:CPG4 domain-containing protein n=1 Tax=Steinernema glaseri TaxID=37863 RepID=A0A1I7Z9E6_9BILA